MILSGSASITKCVYQKKGKYHSRQISVESLGEVIWLSDDKKSGIFESLTRGIVFYDSKDDAFDNVIADDKRLLGSKADTRPLVHSEFGDIFLGLYCLNKYGITELVKNVFGKECYERVIVHILYSFLSIGSRMTVSNFMERSFLPHIFKSVVIDSLRYDEAYFSFMGDDNLKISFFKKFIAMMKEKDKNFGSSVYVDSTPIPTDSDNPLSKLCCHGTGSSCTQIRLALVLDQASGLPVWYDIIPGNEHDYVAIRKKIRLFDSCEIEAFSYIDKDNAESGSKKIQIEMANDKNSKAEFDSKPVNERKKILMNSGFFVLLSNCGFDEKKTLDECFDRTHIEMFFKDAKEGRTLLPLCKWNDMSVRGKILSDMISTMLYTCFRKELSEVKKAETERKRGRKPNGILPLNQLSVSEIISSCSTLMCLRKDDILYIETPMKDAKEYFRFFGLKIQGSMTIKEIKTMLNL